MNKHLVDVLKILPLVGFASIILLPDDSRSIIIFAVGIILLAISLAAVIHKTLYHYIDLKELIEKAKESAVASAMIVLGVIYLLSVIIQSLVALLR